MRLRVGRQRPEDGRLVGILTNRDLETLVEKFSYMRFDPEGITQNPEIPFAKSMPDYIMRWLASRFLDELPEFSRSVLESYGR